MNKETEKAANQMRELIWAVDNLLMMLRTGRSLVDYETAMALQRTALASGQKAWSALRVLVPVDVEDEANE